MENERNTSSVLQVGKGVLFALAIALIAAAIFALLLRFTALSDGGIYPINQTVKAIAVCVGTILCVRGEKGFWKGLAIGGAFWGISYLFFALVGGTFSLSPLSILEIVSVLAVGAVSGALAVNLKKSG